MKTAFVSEIYPTLQGEGPYTGEKQIFLRFAVCPLRCNYCDTPESLTPAGHKRMTVPEVHDRVSEVQRQTSIKTVSVTGGEPLVHAGFLKEVFPLFKRDRLRIYLETAGVHPDGLSQVIDFCDVVSMDLKLPSATGQNFWDQHERFLKIAGEKATFVKVVVEKNSRLEEIERAASLLAERPHPPLLVLQPASPMPPFAEAPPPELVAKAYLLAKKIIPHVAVMPQQHKIWGLR